MATFCAYVLFVYEAPVSYKKRWRKKKENTKFALNGKLSFFFISLPSTHKNYVHF